MARVCQVLALIVMTVLACVPARAAGDIVNAALKAPSLDLLPVLKLVESTSANPAIELPGGVPGQNVLMKLRTRGSGPVFRWVVFTLSNPELIDQNLVVSVPHQGFIGSGVLWPRSQGSRIIGLQASGGPAPISLNTLGTDAITITVQPGATITYAIEMQAAGINQIALWQRAAFDRNVAQRGFFRGVVLGISMFLGIAVICLFIVRPSLLFPAAALFTWSAIGLLALNAGYRDLFVEVLPGEPSVAQIRAVVESLFLAGAVACLAAFLEVHRKSKVTAALLAICFAMALSLSVLGWFAPHVVIGLARLGFAATVGFGLVFFLVFWFGVDRPAQTSLLTWVVLALWTALAAYACIRTGSSAYMEPVISSGLVLVLVTMTFALAQFAFANAVGSHRMMQDSGRRALALAGAEQSVWDWQVDQQSLFVGPELERVLGVPQGSFAGGDINVWLQVIHPADRAGYVSAVEAAEAKGRGTFSQEFRLRRADGTYRWYLLRARAMLGDKGVTSRLIGALSDVTQLKRSEDMILNDAVHDRVTGLPYRALLIDRLGRAMQQARSNHNVELYVLVIDMDRFRSVNEGLGQDVADSLLNVMGARLTKLCGPEDTVARMPGDQFAIVFNGRNPPRDLVSFTEQVRRTVAIPVELRTRELSITASIGVAQFRNERTDPDALLKNAEIALYEAKRRGKNMIEFFRPDMRDDRSNLLAMEQDLRNALDRNEIEVRYQPLMRLDDRQIAGFEALARWRHPTEGLLTPDAFMSVAEDTGVICDIGRFVLAEASRQLGIWQRAFRPDTPLFVSVNVSSAQLLNADLIEDTKQVFSREDIAAGTLKLEITESLVMRNPELAEKMLGRLKQLGVGLSCDDFGTGYSSLSYLRRLPFDTLKIDRSFVAADPEDERASIILDAIIMLAHDLDLDIVAEGIENQDQIDRLAALNCDFGQGFFIGQPVTAKQVIDALGALPYGFKERGRGLMAFWDRMTRSEPGEPAPEPPRITEPEPAPMAPEPARVVTSEVPADEREAYEPEDYGDDYQDYGDAYEADLPDEVPPPPPPAYSPPPLLQRPEPAIPAAAPPPVAAEPPEPPPVPARRARPVRAKAGGPTTRGRLKLGVPTTPDPLPEEDIAPVEPLPGDDPPLADAFGGDGYGTFAEDAPVEPVESEPLTAIEGDADPADYDQWGDYGDQLPPDDYYGPADEPTVDGDAPQVDDQPVPQANGHDDDLDDPQPASRRRGRARSRNRLGTTLRNSSGRRSSGARAAK